MSTITGKDGARIHYKDWGQGQPVVFSHGWPLSADDWDAQVVFFAARGSGASSTTAAGTGARPRPGRPRDGHIRQRPHRADRGPRPQERDSRRPLHGLRRGGPLPRSSRGGAAKGRVAKAVRIGAVPPLMVKTAAICGIDRAQFFRDIPTGPLTGSIVRAQRSRRASSTTGGGRA